RCWMCLKKPSPGPMLKKPGSTLTISVDVPEGCRTVDSTVRFSRPSSWRVVRRVRRVVLFDRRLRSRVLRKRCMGNSLAHGEPSWVFENSTSGVVGRAIRPSSPASQCENESQVPQRFFQFFRKVRETVVSVGRGRYNPFDKTERLPSAGLIHHEV